jgi:Uma2 family endonuclease
MVAQSSVRSAAASDSGDRRFVVYGTSFQSYVDVRRALDDVAGLKITYLEGTMELMSPGPLHEEMKKRIARLVEAYAGVRGIPLNGRGSQTFRKEAKERGLEPDECYWLGPPSSVPKIAIEVVTSRSHINKLRVYEGLRVREVWIWSQGKLSFYRLMPGGYDAREKSEVLPELDVALLSRFLEDADQTRAVEQYRAALRRRKR